MDQYDSSLFRDHIKNRDATTKGKRAQHLYRTFEYDTALPNPWIRHVLSKLSDTTKEVITSNFIWLYRPSNDTFGGPAPLTLLGCDLLERLELLEAND